MRHYAVDWEQLHSRRCGQFSPSTRKTQSALLWRAVNTNSTDAVKLLAVLSRLWLPPFFGPFLRSGHSFSDSELVKGPKWTSSVTSLCLLSQGYLYSVKRCKVTRHTFPVWDQFIVTAYSAVMCILIQENIRFSNPTFFTANVFLAVNTLRSSSAATDQ